MKKTEYRKFRYKGVDFIVGTDGSVDGRQRYSISGSGYMKVGRYDGKKTKHFSVHRIVAAAWLEPPLYSSMNQIDHINGKKWDNRVENLRWVTPKENCANRSRLKGKRVVAVNVKTGCLYEAESPTKLGKLLGISQHTVEKYAKLMSPYENYLFIIGKRNKEEEE